MRIRLEPWAHRLLAIVSAASLVHCGGNTSSGEDGSGGATNPGNSGGSSSGGRAGKGGSVGTGGSAGTVGKGGTSQGGTAQGGSAGTAQGGGGAGGFPCTNPMPLDPEYETGFERCDSFIHRPEAVQCRSLLPRDTSWEPNEFDTCTSDSDCTEKQYGYCDYEGYGNEPGRECVYGCTIDEDCGDGYVCRCGETIGTCEPASCTTDADCGDGFLCATYDDELCTQQSFACQTAADECASTADCAGSPCLLGEDGVRRCADVGCAVAGRPFLVGGEERLAASERRDDWLAAGLEPNCSGVSPAERAELAREWQRVGLMEHASIAAFARFTLELLAVGAPAELVQASNAAALDETRHAELCFALASAYAGEKLGPGALSIDGALDRVSLESLVVTAIHEGCVGETLAAIEAAEQHARAQDPLVRRVLEQISADETRHAELAWRFVAWAVERGGAALRAKAKVALEAACQRALGAVEGTERDLLAHGVLSRRERSELRARALERVVGPCAEALLGGGRSAVERARVAPTIRAA